jgi:hypothetical protein
MYSSARIVPSKAHRWAAGLSCCVLVGLAIGTLPYASRPAPVEAAFLPIFVTLAAMSDLFTAFLLLLQFRAAGYLPLALLAIAYTTTGTIIVAQACSFPGLMSEHGLFGARPQTGVWLWTAWHGGFPALVILYALGRKGRSVGMEPKPIVVAGVLLVGITLGLAAACLAYLAPLPTLVSGSNYSAGFHGPWQVVITFVLRADTDAMGIQERLMPLAASRDRLERVLIDRKAIRSCMRHPIHGVRPISLLTHPDCIRS